jgi:hypothetical protein
MDGLNHRDACGAYSERNGSFLPPQAEDDDQPEQGRTTRKAELNPPQGVDVNAVHRGISCELTKFLNRFAPAGP